MASQRASLEANQTRHPVRVLPAGKGTHLERSEWGGVVSVISSDNTFMRFWSSVVWVSYCLDSFFFLLILEECVEGTQQFSGWRFLFIFLRLQTEHFVFFELERWWKMIWEAFCPSCSSRSSCRLVAAHFARNCSLALPAPSRQSCCTLSNSTVCNLSLLTKVTGLRATSCGCSPDSWQRRGSWLVVQSSEFSDWLNKKNVALTQW